MSTPAAGTGSCCAHVMLGLASHSVLSVAVTLLRGEHRHLKAQQTTSPLHTYCVLPAALSKTFNLAKTLIPEP